MSSSTDFAIYKALWSIINDVCAPPPLPGAPAKACFLMENPGFSVDPNAFDPSKFNPGTGMSPDCAEATLCDRVPAVAQDFCDTGSHISFFWKQFLETFTIKKFPDGNAALKKRYNEAIKMLYGGREEYTKQQKTPFFQNLDILRAAWEDKEKTKSDFRQQCFNDETNWPGNFERGAGPYLQAEKEAYTAYNNLKMQVEKFQAAIFAYASGDLTTLMLEQKNGKCDGCL